MLNGFGRHHGAHIRSSRGISDHTGSAADKSNRLVACHLKPLHQAKRHEVADMERIRRGVKADVKNGFSVVDKLPDFFFVRYLSDEAAGNKFFIYLHYFSSVIF